MKAPVLVLVAAAACGGGDPVDVSGEYTVAVTNRDNGCMLENFNPGDTATGIPVVITQDDDAITVSINGAAGVVLDFALGAHVYTGAVAGDSFELELLGTRGLQQGNCAFTFNSTIAGTLDGDVLTGAIDYRAATNGNPDCAALEGCRTFQDFNGTRPPR